MSRVQYVETVTAPIGINGALMPLSGIGTTPYVVDSNGNEGGQANAYAGRTGATAASTLVTDASGTVSYWLDAGDYNIHVADQQSPPRIASYVRGFTAPVINTDQIVVAAQNLIQFTGDTKFSLQTADHGLKSDGSYEWLLVTNDPDGGGRQIDGSLYTVLRSLLGNPPLTSGKFRLPNISGRALIAAGAASGLTVRNLLDMFGTETETMDIAHMPSHSHRSDNAGGAGGTTGGATIPSVTNLTTTDAGNDHTHTGPGGTPIMYTTNGQGVSAAVVSTSAASGPYASGTPSGNFGVPTNNNNPWGTGTTGNANTAHHHTYSIPAINIPNLTVNAQGGGQAQNNIQPSAGMNLFVKT